MNRQEKYMRDMGHYKEINRNNLFACHKLMSEVALDLIKHEDTRDIGIQLNMLNFEGLDSIIKDLVSLIETEKKPKEL